MKFLSLFFVLSMASAAHAENFFCHESKEDALKAHRAQYAVWIKELSDVTDGRVTRGYDYAKNVLVSVMTRNPHGTSKFAPIQTFKAVAKSADVSYSIQAKTEGVSVHIYLDELDQTSLYVRGLTKAIQMTCSGSDLD